MYIVLMEPWNENKIGEIIKQKRVSIPLTLNELSSTSGVSQSHIGRIERGERLPSARVLRKIAEPLGFQAEELFMLAGFLTASTSDKENSISNIYHNLAIDPLVANVLSHEPVEVQRAVIGILGLLKSIAQTNR
jgi:transcriptional regulator with XRE-family HTH domain